MVFWMFLEGDVLEFYGPSVQFSLPRPCISPLVGHTALDSALLGLFLQGVFVFIPLCNPVFQKMAWLG